MIKKANLLPWLIVAISTAVILQYALTFTLRSDALREYHVMLAMMEAGTWAVVNGEALLASCMFTTYIPGLITTHFNLPPEMVYRLFPCLFTIWTPLLVYLIARRYVSPGIAFIAALFLIGQNYYLWAASFARIGIAVMFFALAMYLLLGDRLNGWRKYLLITCAIGITFSHYGTAFLTLILIGAWLVVKGYLYVMHRIKTPVSWETICGYFFTPLLLLTYLWHQVIVKNAVGIGIAVVKKAVGEVVDAESISFFKTDGRDSVIQVAFGSTFMEMNAPQRIEFVFSWLMILLVTFGLIYVVWKLMDIRGLALLGYLLLVWTVVSPYTGHAYGIARVYFQTSIILLPCLALGLRYLGDRLKVSAAGLGLVAVIPYMLCTSGIMHKLFGLDRWL